MAECARTDTYKQEHTVVINLKYQCVIDQRLSNGQISIKILEVKQWAKEQSIHYESITIDEHLMGAFILIRRETL